MLALRAVPASSPPPPTSAHRARTASAPRPFAPSLLVAALALAPAGVRSADGPARVAVLPVPSAAPASAAVASALVEAVREAGAEPVPPEEVARAVATAKQDPATCGATPACAAAACAALGARALVVASVTSSGPFWMVEVRLREARGGWIKGQGVLAVDPNARAAQDAVAKLAARILPPYLSGSPPAAAATPASPRPAAVPVPLPPPPVAPTPPPTRAEGAALEVRAPRPASVTEKLNAQVATPAPRGRTEAGRGGNVWGTLLVGGGAVLLAGGAAAGLVAWSEERDAELALARGDVGTWAVRRRSSQTLVLTSAGVGGLGAAVLVAGVWVRLGARSSPVAVEVEPAGVRLSLAF